MLYKKEKNKYINFSEEEKELERQYSKDRYNKLKKIELNLKNELLLVQ